MGKKYDVVDSLEIDSFVTDHLTEDEMSDTYDQVAEVWGAWDVEIQMQAVLEFVALLFVMHGRVDELPPQALDLPLVKWVAELYERIDELT